jgi:rod shape-determining protein MreD
MKHVWYILLLALCFLLQVTVLNYFRSSYVVPDLLFMFVFLASISFPFRPALFLSVACGFLADMAGTGSFGIHLVLFPLWSVLVVRLSKRIVLDNLLFSSLAVGVLAFLNAVCIWAFLRVQGSAIPWSAFLRTTVIESFYAAVLMPFVLLLIRTLSAAIVPATHSIEDETI